MRFEANKDYYVQGRPYVRGPLDKLAVAAERLDHLVVAGAVPEVGRHADTQHALHRMFLERPDAVVAHHADDRDAVPDHGVELHRRKPKGAIARKQDHLPVGTRELRRHRVARAGAEASERTRVDPQPRFLALDEPARERDEVAAVADDDRVRIRKAGDLRDQARRMYG